MNLIFDLYGTLIDIRTDESRPSFWKAIQARYKTYGVYYRTPKDMQAAYLKRVHEAEEALSHKTGDPSPEIRLEDVFARLIVKTDDLTPEDKALIKAKRQDTKLMLNIALYFRRKSRDYLFAYPHTISTLKTLKEQGHHIYLLSNAQAIFTLDELDRTGVRPLLDKIYISSDYGMKKPTVGFMLALLKEQHLDPSTCLMIGNDMTSDMTIAARTGVRGVFLNTDNHSDEDIQQLIRNLQKENNTTFVPEIIKDGDIENLIDIVKVAGN